MYQIITLFKLGYQVHIVNHTSIICFMLNDRIVTKLAQLYAKVHKNAKLTKIIKVMEINSVGIKNNNNLSINKDRCIEFLLLHLAKISYGIVNSNSKRGIVSKTNKTIVSYTKHFEISGNNDLFTLDFCKEVGTNLQKRWLITQVELS